MDIKNIILDLDSTVINSLRPDERQPKGFIGYTMMDDKDKYADFIVYERPHLQEFLDFIFANYNVAVWTAASQDYAIFIVDKILIQNRPERKLKFLLFDYHTDLFAKDNDILKDLRFVYKTFPEFNEKNTIIVDDNPEVFSLQLPNAYPIPAFEVKDKDAINDKELLYLIEKLKTRMISNLVSEATITKVLQNTSVNDEDEEDDEDYQKYPKLKVYPNN